MKGYRINKKIVDYSLSQRADSGELRQINTSYEWIFNDLDIKFETKKEYLYRVRLFLNFLNSSGMAVDTLKRYKIYLDQRTDFSISTKNKYLVVAKLLSSQVFRLQMLPFDMGLGVRLFTQIKKHKRFGFTQVEIERINKEIQCMPQNKFWFRLRAIYALLSLQGLRLIEIVRLKVEDIDIVAGTALIQGKGNDDSEVVYLHPKTVSVVREYMKRNRINSGCLFRSLGSKDYGGISTDTVRRDMKRITDSLSIEKTVHGFRHSYITTLLNNMDIRDVRKFSRHKNIEMLIVYDDEIDIQTKSSIAFQCFNYAF